MAIRGKESIDATVYGHPVAGNVAPVVQHHCFDSTVSASAGIRKQGMAQLLHQMPDAMVLTHREVSQSRRWLLTTDRNLTAKSA